MFLFSHSRDTRFRDSRYADILTSLTKSIWKP